MIHWLAVGLVFNAVIHPHRNQFCVAFVHTSCMSNVFCFFIKKKIHWRIISLRASCVGQPLKHWSGTPAVSHSCLTIALLQCHIHCIIICVTCILHIFYSFSLWFICTCVLPCLHNCICTICPTTVRVRLTQWAAAGGRMWRPLAPLLKRWSPPTTQDPPHLFYTLLYPQTNQPSTRQQFTLRKKTLSLTPIPTWILQIRERHCIV